LGRPQNGTNFSSFLDFRFILSITAQSIFALEPSAWTCWEGISIDNFTKLKNKKNNNNKTHFFVLLGVTENGTTQKTYFYYFSNLRLSLASSLKTAGGRYILFRKY
jgi:hypothetical protein